ncbi:MAG TPA: ATP-grasp domain-containing protein [Acidimicrobiales bacterium]|nr:ATP-grasp domain-containing protein [Acidimicrobiales bacterium]
MQRVLLLLPTATYRATEFLAAAAGLGVEVVTGSEQRQALAGVMGDTFVELPLHDPDAAAEEIVRFARRVPLDAVVAVDDQGGLSAALAAERLGLRHNPPAAVAATRDKATMRALLARHGVPQPEFAVLRPEAGADVAGAVAAAAARIGFPAVVKPCSLSGSRGVIRVDDGDGARAAAARVRAILDDAGEPQASPLLVERFFPGGEVALEGIVDAGRLHVLAVFDKPDPLDGPYFEETIYVTPSRHRPEAIAAVVEAVGAAVAALGLSDGPVHGEARIGPDPRGGRPEVVVLEVAARTIGGRCATVLRFATGETLEQVVLAQALGRHPAGAPLREGSAAGVMMLPIPVSGRLVGVGGVERALAVADVTGIEISIAPGRPVRALPEGDRYLGFLFARAATPELVEAALRAAHAELDVRIAA